MRQSFRQKFLLTYDKSNCVDIEIRQQCLTRSRHIRRKSGLLISEEVETATNRWVRRARRGVNPDLQTLC